MAWNLLHQLKRPIMLIINFHLNCYMDTESLNITNFDQEFIQARSTESGFSRKHQIPVLVYLKWIELGHRLNKIQNTTYGKNLWKSKCFLLKRILLLILISFIFNSTKILLYLVDNNERTIFDRKTLRNINYYP